VSTQNSTYPEKRSSGPSTRRKVDWFSIALVILAIGGGILIALAIRATGNVALAIIPGLFLVVAVISEPNIGLAGFIFVTYAQLSQVGISQYGIPSLAQPLAGALVFLILVRIFLYREQPRGWMHAAPFLASFVVIWLVSFANAGDYTIASATFIGFVKDALGAVIIVGLIQSPRSFRVAIWSLILTGLFLGTITTYQGLTHAYATNLWGFGLMTSQTAGSGTNIRLSGPYANPNAYAQIMLVVVPLALDRLWHERAALPRLVAGLALAVSAISVVYTFSRNGFVSMVFAVGFLFVQRRPNIFPWILTLFLAIGLVQFLPATFTQRISTLVQFVSGNDNLTDPSFRGRVSENLSAWRMFQDHPLLGVGLGNYKVNYQNYSRAIGLDPRRDPRTAANLYLEWLSEDGLVGTVLILLVLGIIARNLYRAVTQFTLARLQTEAYMAMALLAGFAGYMFAAINKNSAYSNVFWLIIGVMLAGIQVAQTSLSQAGNRTGTSGDR
jgi:putative inorganic carbon (hco3(-)) transporter